jgi:hypothetical protein
VHPLAAERGARLAARQLRPDEIVLVYTAGMSSAEQQPEEPRVHSYPPDEALRHARPLPPRERFVLEDVPEEDWAALREALAEA